MTWPHGTPGMPRSSTRAINALRRLNRKFEEIVTDPATSLILGKILSPASAAKNNLPIPPVNLLKRIAVIRLDEIGDVVLTGPFLRELRKAAPETLITLVVKPAVHNLVEFCPYVDEVLTFQNHTALSPLRRFLEILAFSQTVLRRRRFDLVIIPRWDFDIYNALSLAFFSNASWRIGFSERVNLVKQALNHHYDLFLTHAVDSRGIRHEVLRSLEMLPILGAHAAETTLEAWTTPQDDAFAVRFLERNGVGVHERIIGLGPFCRDPKRTWPMERYIDLASWMSREFKARIMVVGGEEDSGHRESFGLRLGSSLVFSAGSATLRQTMSLLRHCRLFIGNDSGPMHLAASVGLPVVEISAHPKDGDRGHANSPARFGPWNVPRIILQPDTAIPPCTGHCRSDSSHCIKRIELETVKDAAARMFRNVS